MAGRWRLYKKRGAVMATGIMLSLGLAIIPGASAVTIGGPSDCDDNAIIKCGAHSTSALVSAYNSSAYVQKVYAAFGISAADMAGLPSTDAVGRVTRDGRVFVENQEQPVATGAVTGGRQNMAGSTQVTSQGATFFKRPPSVSFQQSSLPAFVSMKNGRFQFAIIASCGNAVMATPVAPPKPAPKPSVGPARPVSKPKPQPPAKPQPNTPTPPPETAQPTQTQAQQQQQTVNQNVTQNQQVTVNATTTSQSAEQSQPTTPAAPETPTTSAETVAAAPAPQSQPETAPETTAAVSLPNVGPGGGLGALFITSTIAGIVGYRRWLLHNLGN